MHELSLYGQISNHDYDRVRQQLAGVCRMQPSGLEEIHIVLKARTPVGLEKVQSAGGTQGIQQQDVQKLKTMLNSGIHYVQLVGSIKDNVQHKSQDIRMNDGEEPAGEAVDLSSKGAVTWSFELKDTPESGKQLVSSRLTSRIPIEQGDIIAFVKAFGYEYMSRYYVQGCRFFDQDTTIRLGQILQLPNPSNVLEACDVSKLNNSDTLRPLDHSGSYVIQVYLDIADGNNQDLKERGIKQLLAVKEMLRPAVDLTPGDRLSFDTRIAIQNRR